MKIETKKVIEEWKKGNVVVNEDGGYIALIVGEDLEKMIGGNNERNQ